MDNINKTSTISHSRYTIKQEWKTPRIPQIRKTDIYNNKEMLNFNKLIIIMNNSRFPYQIFLNDQKIKNSWSKIPFSK